MARDAITSARKTLDRIANGDNVTKERLTEVLEGVVSYLDQPHEISLTIDKDTGLIKGTYA